MRVKNEERYLAKGLESLVPLGGPIILLDDGSTDSTGDIASNCDSVVYHRQDDMPMDEGRDRTFLLREALKLKPKWIFTLDGDEELPPTTPPKMLRAIENAPEDVNAFGMWLAVMWNPNRYYVGRHIWEMDRLFRVSAVADDDYEFSSKYASNLHCGCVPELKHYNRQRLNAFIKYWGYESHETAMQHLGFYQEHDEVNRDKVMRLNLERMKSGATAPWRDSLDANDIGKRSTNY
jgi:glycosyltransferase involved in cell wall biosynthesis